MTNRIAYGVGALLGAALLILSPTAAGAAENVTAEEHCAVEVVPSTATNQPDSPVCFATPAELSNFLESVGVGDGAYRGVTANVLIGTVYKDANGSGSSLAFYGASGCAGVTFGFSSLASGWDNSISSARGLNGCWLTMYTTTSYGGSKLNCTPYCSSIGGWNDNVKSLVFRPSGTFGRP